MTNLENEEQERARLENEHWTNLKSDLDFLHSNPQFQRVVLEGYFKDKAVNGVSMLANDYTIRNGKRGEIIEALIAISHLQDYFITINSMGTIPPFEEDEEMED